MIDSLNKFIPDAHRIWVLDRSTDDSVDILNDLGEFYIKTEYSDSARHVSGCRNLGLSYTRNDADVIFLDGDRYIKKFNMDFISTDKDILLFPVDQDERDDPKWFTDYSMVYGHLHNGFYSCGVFFKRNSIKKILEYQGEMFDTSLEEYWGVEDVHLGDVCYHLGLSCDLYKDIRLNGCFDPSKKIPLEAWRARVRKRLDLNVIW